MELNLLEKTEVRITNLELENVNLTDLANKVASVLELPSDKVLVIDVRNDHIALDILQKNVKAEQVFGKKTALLQALHGLPGITIKPTTEIHSDGILGYIGLDEEEAKFVLSRTQALASSLSSAKKGKIKVFPTGLEIIHRKIEDTNSPFLAKKLGEGGFFVEIGQVINDVKEDIVEKLREAAELFGVVITTGGVGAEDKDFTIEGILSLDPQAATPYIVKFTKGQGRHLKDGVRIGVGEYKSSLLIALPGPHDEVKIAAPVITEGLKKGLNKEQLAHMLVEALRARLRDKTAHWHHHN